MTYDEESIRTILDLNEYENRDTAKIDIIFTLKTFYDLRLSVEKCAAQQSDKKSQKLISLKGTIPVRIREATYNIPIQIYLLKNHPIESPLVFVRPVKDMVINQSEYVDDIGLVNHSYLTEWKSPRSNTHSLINVLCQIFSEKCPVYSETRKLPQKKSFMKSLLTLNNSFGAGSGKKNSNKKRRTTIKISTRKQNIQDSTSLETSNNDAIPDYAQVVGTSKQTNSDGTEIYSDGATNSSEEYFPSSMDSSMDFRDFPKSTMYSDDSNSYSFEASVTYDRKQSFTPKSCPATPNPIREELISRTRKWSMDKKSKSHSKSSSKNSLDKVGKSKLSAGNLSTTSNTMKNANFGKSRQNSVRDSNSRCSSKLSNNLEGGRSNKMSLDILSLDTSLPFSSNEFILESTSRDGSGCPFASVGCDATFDGSDWSVHINESTQHHVNLLLIRTNTLTCEMKRLEAKYTSSEENAKKKQIEVNKTQAMLHETEERLKFTRENLRVKDNSLQESEKKVREFEGDVNRLKNMLEANDKLLKDTQNELGETKTMLKESEVRLKVTKEMLYTKERGFMENIVDKPLLNGYLSNENDNYDVSTFDKIEKLKHRNTNNRLDAKSKRELFKRQNTIPSPANNFTQEERIKEVSPLQMNGELNTTPTKLKKDGKNNYENVNGGVPNEFIKSNAPPKLNDVNEEDIYMAMDKSEDSQKFLNGDAHINSNFYNNNSHKQDVNGSAHNCTNQNDSGKLTNQKHDFADRIEDGYGSETNLLNYHNENNMNGIINDSFLIKT